MKFDLKRFSISLLFCLIFIVSLFSPKVFGATVVGYFPSTNLQPKTYGNLYANIDSNYATIDIKKDISLIGGEIRKYHCEKFLESAENGFLDMNFILEVKVEAIYQVEKVDTNGTSDTSDDTHYLETEQESLTFPITDLELDFLSEGSNLSDYSLITIEIGDTTYQMYAHTTKAWIKDDDGDYYTSLKSGVYNSGDDSEKGRAPWKNRYNNAYNASQALQYFEDCAIEGIIAGSIGAGYNVATPYSDAQVPLADITEWTGYGRDFKNIGSVDFALSYYYSPIFGPLYVNKDPYIPTTTEDWIEYGKNHTSEFIEGNGVKLHSGFSDFVATLSETQVNENGEKIVDIRIDNGAKRMNIAGSKDPKSVLSYNIQMAVPFLFQVQNGRAQLATNYLRVFDDYTFNIYNDHIYNLGNNQALTADSSVTTMTEVMGGDMSDYIYLFSQVAEITNSAGKKESRKYGIVLIGMFDETVIDTTVDKGDPKEYNSAKLTSNLLLTGRKIGLDNGYSDSLPLENDNSSLMFARGRGSMNKLGISPQSFSFPVTSENLKLLDLKQVFTGDLENVALEFVNEVDELLAPWDDATLYDYINKKEMHGELPKNVSVVRFLVDFGEVVIEPSAESDTGDYAFFIIRNNAYVHDEGLIEWLKTDNAQSLKNVKAELLLAKILGDFSDDITELSYEDWLAIQEIKGELQAKKDRWLIDFMNVVSIVLGVALMILAALFILAYWIDIFNTFSDFSILQMISFGNLYSVSSDDMGFYMHQEKGNCKYVTFKDVIIIACIMIFFGLLFINITSIVSLIIYLYHYFMKILFGGV